MGSEQRLWLQVGISFAVISAALFGFVGPDLTGYLFPWIEQLRASGFAHPVGNYTPPYLYLLWALPSLPSLVAVKGLAIAGVLLLALAIRSLLRSFGVSTEGAAFVPLLPSVLFNGPFIGQCDSYWVAACVMAVAARDKPLQMSAWAGLAFAFKAQAAFIAPFVLAELARSRAWPAFPIPPAIYVAAVLPAWACGWPLADLLTIYVRQFGDVLSLSTAPNLWAFPALAVKSLPGLWLLVPFAMTVAAVAQYWRRYPGDPLRAALLAAIIVPFFLPRMHERYFLLADILALCFSLREGRWTMALLVQCGSVLSLAAYATHVPLLNAIGSLPMALALALLTRRNDCEPRTN